VGEITEHGNQFSDISPLVAEPVETILLLAFSYGRFDASMLRQAQQPQGSATTGSTSALMSDTPVLLCRSG